MAKVKERKRGRKPMALRLAGREIAPTVTGGAPTTFTLNLTAPVKGARAEEATFTAPKGSKVIPKEITDEALGKTTEANVREILRLAAIDSGMELSCRSLTIEWEDKRAVEAGTDPGVVFYLAVKNAKAEAEEVAKETPKAPAKRVAKAPAKATTTRRTTRAAKK